MKIAQCELQLKNKFEAANSYIEAANMYKKTSTSGAVVVVVPPVAALTKPRSCLPLQTRSVR